MPLRKQEIRLVSDHDEQEVPMQQSHRWQWGHSSGMGSSTPALPYQKIRGQSMWECIHQFAGDLGKGQFLEILTSQRAIAENRGASEGLQTL